MCKTGKHENNETPQWDFCCYVHGHHEHSEFVFSVFDADFSGDEGDLLGTAVLPGNATAGSYELALSGGEFEIDADAPPPTLTVSIPLFPPPPPPPDNIDAVKVTGGASDKLLFNEAKAGAEAHELHKYLCVMSAKGLIESDFFPRVGKYRYPDTWVKISTFREENKRMGLSAEFVDYALTHGDERTKQIVYRAMEQYTTIMTKDMEEDIMSDLENEDEVTEEHNGRQGGQPKYECATGVVYNSLEPNWSFCCDITKAADKAFLLELFDEDTLYFVNDYLGANLMTDLDDGQYELPIIGGVSGHSDAGAYLNVQVITSKHEPIDHVGEDCWEACGGKGGLCPGYCGALGACCKAPSADAALGHEPGCPDHGTDPYWHSCVCADLTTLGDKQALSAEPRPTSAPDRGGSAGSPLTAILLSSSALLLAAAAAARRRRAGAVAVPAEQASGSLL